MKNMDEELNLEQLLTRCQEMDSETWFSLYYDPGTSYFFMNYVGVMPFWIPRAAVYIGRCRACDVRGRIEQLMRYAVRKLTDKADT